MAATNPVDRSHAAPADRRRFGRRLPLWAGACVLLALSKPSRWTTDACRVIAYVGQDRVNALELFLNSEQSLPR